jgi:ssDNA-binding Zn-finger/Zn-ribbon topoisomerase 1|tara:strand:+ start:577 stop:735 length:159 start_codon:yes stop_codon:yes gene_type:complete
MSNYPEGAWTDPRAPWNERFCPECGGTIEEAEKFFGKSAECLDCDWTYEEDV